MADKILLEKNYQLHYQTGKKFLERNNLVEALEAFKRAGSCAVDLVSCTTGQEQNTYRQNAKNMAELIKGINDKLNTPKAPPITNNKPEKEGDEQPSKFNVVESTGVTFDDVIGCDDVKNFVRRDWIKRFDPKYKDAFSGKYFTPMERGMLLYGLPGTGKTMMARAIATEVKASFYSIDASQIVDKYVGESEKAIAGLFEEASKKERAIVFIDEIDSILAEPKSGSQNYEKSALNEWLKKMDGFNKEKVANVICIGATNYPNDIAPSALRGGRLGVHFRVDLPNLELRQKIVDKTLDPELLEDDVDIKSIAKRLACFTTADVVSVCNRIKSISQLKLIEMIDNEQSGRALISAKEVNNLFKNMHSSINERSIDAILEFENNLKIENPNGSVADYMNTLKRESL